MKKGKYKFQDELQDVTVYETKEEFIDHIKYWIEEYVNENDLMFERDFDLSQMAFFIKSMNQILSERFYISVVDERNIIYGIEKAIEDNNNDKFIEILKSTKKRDDLIKRDTTIKSK